MDWNGERLGQIGGPLRNTVSAYKGCPRELVYSSITWRLRRKLPFRGWRDISVVKRIHSSYRGSRFCSQNPGGSSQSVTWVLSHLWGVVPIHFNSTALLVSRIVLALKFHVCVYVCVCIYTHTHTYTHMHIHTHIWRQKDCKNQIVKDY